jgi:hypothetical protein
VQPPPPAAWLGAERLNCCTPRYVMVDFRQSEYRQVTRTHTHAHTHTHTHKRERERERDRERETERERVRERELVSGKRSAHTPALIHRGAAPPTPLHPSAVLA